MLYVEVGEIEKVLHARAEIVSFYMSTFMILWLIIQDSFVNEYIFVPGSRCKRDGSQ